MVIKAHWRLLFILVTQRTAPEGGVTLHPPSFSDCYSVSRVRCEGCACVGVGDLEEQPRVLLVIFRLMRGHSWGRKCPGTAAYSWLCVCAPAAVCMCGVYLRGGGGGCWGKAVGVRAVVGWGTHLACGLAGPDVCHRQMFPMMLIAGVRFI